MFVRCSPRAVSKQRPRESQPCEPGWRVSEASRVRGACVAVEQCLNVCRIYIYIICMRRALTLLSLPTARHRQRSSPADCSCFRRGAARPRRRGAGRRQAATSRGTRRRAATCTRRRALPCRRRREATDRSGGAHTLKKSEAAVSEVQTKLAEAERTAVMLSHLAAVVPGRVLEQWRRRCGSLEGTAE